MKEALKDSPKTAFLHPERIISAKIVRATGLLASEGTEKTVIEYFVKGTQPKITTQEKKETSGSSQEFFMDE